MKNMKDLNVEIDGSVVLSLLRSHRSLCDALPKKINSLTTRIIPIRISLAVTGMDDRIIC